jgi:polyvinyl alcohol dehydrogenase (cytochrome)
MRDPADSGRARCAAGIWPQAILLLLALSAGAHAGAPPETSPPSAPPPVERRGTELGFAVFQQHCVACHGNKAYERAPSPAALRAMSPERIYAALTGGLMKAVGDTLTEADRRRVAESMSGQLLGSEAAGDARAMAGRCPGNPRLRDDTAPGWNGWGNGSANLRFQAASAAGIDARSVGSLKLKWAFGFPGGTSAHAQPAIVAGRVFVGSDIGYVYSLDAATGCVYWSYRAGAGVRTAMTLGTIQVRGRPRQAVFFGDLKATAYAIDAQDGTLIWKTRVDEHFATRITAAPALYGGRLYVPVSAWEGFQARVLDYPCCTAVGSVSALDARTGRRLWKTYSIAQAPRPTVKNSRGVQQWAPAGVPIWNTPTVDAARHRVYAGTGDASTYPAPSTSDAILALDLETGKLRWSRQIYADDAFIVGCSGEGRTENCPPAVGPDWDIPMSPMLGKTAAGRELLVFGTKPGEVLALDPDRQGEIVWRTTVISVPLRHEGGGLRGPLWGGAMDASRVYFGLGEGGAVALSLEDGRIAWRTPLNAGAASPVSHTAAVTLLPGVLLTGGSDGRLWALSSSDGQVLWSFDTAQPFTTVNGVAAHGGTISAPGPVVAGGLLLLGSGYGVVSGTPGNVLLAFGVAQP